MYKLMKKKHDIQKSMVTKQFLFFDILTVSLGIIIMLLFSLVAINIYKENNSKNIDISYSSREFEKLSTHTLFLLQTEDQKTYDAIFLELNESLNLVKNQILFKDKYLDEEYSDLFLDTSQNFVRLVDSAAAIHREKILLKKGFQNKTLLEKQLRYDFYNLSLEMNDPVFLNNVWKMKYLSKEVLYQYLDEKHLEEWIASINIVENEINKLNLPLNEKNLFLEKISKYKTLAQELGNLSIKMKKIESDEILALQGLESLNNKIHKEFDLVDKDISEQNSKFAKELFWILLSGIILSGTLVILGRKILLNKLLK